MAKSKDGIIERLKPYISDEPSSWLNDAKKRERNEWWMRYWIHVEIKYYRLLRFLKLRKS